MMTSEIDNTLAELGWRHFFQAQLAIDELECDLARRA